MRVSLKNETWVEIALPPPSEHPAIFAFGMHKCGSTLLNRVVLSLCRCVNRPTVSLPNIFFHQGFADEVWVDQQSMVPLIQDGYCYCGFRYYPVFFDHCGLIWNRKNILLVRDPRDAIVSMYYSVAYSHVSPDDEKAKKEFADRRADVRQQEINQFCLEYAQEWIHQWNRVLNTLVKNEHTLIFRYEDVVFDKIRLVSDINDHLELGVDRELQHKIAQRYDIIPEKEDKSKHIRFVKPGNHKDRLKPETIDKINELYAPVLSHFDY